MNAKKLSLAGNVVGSGMLARAFLAGLTEGSGAVCIYAAGVSNSNCTDVNEFERERQRLEQALQHTIAADPFVYFGTCSVADPEARKTPYVQHKLAMERIVGTHPRYLIFRLPQVVGKTPNPHTLLNFLYARIARSERFTVWRNARRNVIDVDDVVSIARQLIADDSMRNTTLNIANPLSHTVIAIVQALEETVGKPAVYDLVNCGSEYTIDAREATLAAVKVGVVFSGDYLNKVMGKYYGNLE